MTEPDEALLWARENSPPHIYVELANAANAYRAGAAASAERIKELEARVAELERRLNGGAGGTPVGPYDLPQMRAYFVGTPPIAKISDQ